MTSVAPAILWLACGFGTASGQEQALPPPAATAQCPGEDYQPQEGDLLFFTYHKLLWNILFRVGHSGPPFHVGIVVRMPEGELRLLEAGSLAPERVHVVDVKPRLQQYKGDVWVRRLSQPLTLEQSHLLTEFALEQVGRRFAKIRVGLEAVSNRTLSVMRYRMCGPPPTDRHSWYCSEMVVAAGIRIGLLPTCFSGPRMLFPHDLFYDCPRSIASCWQSPIQLIFPPCPNH
jgi:hypothetical protein